MKRILITSIVTLMMILGIGVFMNENVRAEGESGPVKTSLTISPASRTLQIASGSSYDGVLTVSNDGTNDITVQVYATPYSYVYSEQDDEYKLGYSLENAFTQISRWITIEDANGQYVPQATFVIRPEEKREVKYRISTPSSIPAGGQYAVIFAQVKSGSSATGAVKADPGLGMTIYGRSTEGETIVAAEVRDVKLEQAFKKTGEGENDKKSIFYGSAKIKNAGNVDFFARGTLSVDPIIGFASYKTPTNQGMISVIPESELVLSDEWEDVPDFGIYRLIWTVSAGESIETIERTIFLFPPVAIIITILVLTMITVGIIMLVKRRKVRRSRLAI